MPIAISAAIRKRVVSERKQLKQSFLRPGPLRLEHFVAQQRALRPVGAGALTATLPALGDFPMLAQFLETNRTFFPYIFDHDVRELSFWYCNALEWIDRTGASENSALQSCTTGLRTHLAAMALRDSLFAEGLDEINRKNPQAIFIPKSLLRFRLREHPSTFVEKYDGGAVGTIDITGRSLNLHAILDVVLRQGNYLPGKPNKPLQLLLGRLKNAGTVEARIADGHQYLALQTHSQPLNDENDSLARVYVVADRTQQLADAMVPTVALPFSMRGLQRGVCALLLEQGELNLLQQGESVGERVIAARIAGLNGGGQPKKFSSRAEWLGSFCHQEPTRQQVQRVFGKKRIDVNLFSELLTYIAVAETENLSPVFGPEPRVILHDSEWRLRGPKKNLFGFSIPNAVDHPSPDCSMGYFDEGVFHLLVQCETKVDGGGEHVQKAINQLMKRKHYYGSGLMYAQFRDRTSLFRVDTTRTESIIALPKGGEVGVRNLPPRTRIMTLGYTFDEMLQHLQTQPGGGVDSRRSRAFKSPEIPRFHGIISAELARMLEERFEPLSTMINLLVNAEFFDTALRAHHLARDKTIFSEKKALFDETTRQYRENLERGYRLWAYSLEHSTEIDLDSRDLVQRIFASLNIPHDARQPYRLTELPLDRLPPPFPNTPLDYWAPGYAMRCFIGMPEFFRHFHLSNRTFTPGGFGEYP